MKKLIVLSVGAFLVAGMASAACVSFDQFCDGLQVSLVGTGGGTAISGFWSNFDCGGSDQNGIGRFIPGTGVFCAELDAFAGMPFCFAVTPTGGGNCTFDLYQNNGSGGVNLFLDNSPCTIIPGNCPFEPEGERGIPSFWRALLQDGAPSQ